MPVFNRAHCVERALEGVYTQEFKDWEFLVVDDASTDRSVAVLERHRDRIRLFRQEKNTGPYVARNHALKNSRGQLIAFLDSDDQWRPHRLSSQLPLMENGTVGLVFGDSHFVSWDGGDPRRQSDTYFEKWKPHRGRVTKELCRENFIPQSSVLARRECFERLGGFSLASPRAADYAKWIQISMHYDLDYVLLPVMDYGRYGDNFSGTIARKVVPPVELFKELLASAPDMEHCKALSRVMARLEIESALAAFRHGATLMKNLVLNRTGGSRERLSLGEILASFPRLRFRWSRQVSKKN